MKRLDMNILMDRIVDALKEKRLWTDIWCHRCGRRWEDFQTLTAVSDVPKVQMTTTPDEQVLITITVGGCMGEDFYCDYEAGSILVTSTNRYCIRQASKMFPVIYETVLQEI